MIRNALGTYVDMWQMALWPRNDGERLMRFPMVLHLAAIVLFATVLTKGLT